MTYLLLIYASIALGVAALLALVSWIVEILLGRRVGLCMSYVTNVLVVCFIAYVAYADAKFCKDAPFPHCEWSPLMYIFLYCLALITIPTLLASTFVMKKWSDKRTKQPA